MQASSFTPPHQTASKPSLQDAKVVVVSTRACPYCKRAKEALGNAGHAYATVDVSDAAELRAQVREATGSRTVPQIFVNGKSIGGSDTLLSMIADGSFTPLVDSAVAPALPPPLLQAALQAQAAAAATPGPQGPSPALVTLAEAMLKAGTGVPRSETIIGGRRVRTFTGRQAVGWLQSHQGAEGASGREAVLQTAQQLLQYNLISSCPQGDVWICPEQQPFADSTVARYMLVSEAPNPTPGQALNTHYCWYGPTRPATQVATELRQLILDLYERHLSADGKAVSYKRLGADPLFKRYVDASAELQRLDLAPLSTPELTALFINLYNALIVHGLVVWGTSNSTLQRAKFFAGVKYNIGGLEYSADDMENGVLRGNRAAASNLWSLVGLPQMSKGQFPKVDDPRRKKIVAVVDPRIHFALVCGAKSCPPIKLYTPENLDEGLDAAGEAFCASEVVVDRTARTVSWSKIFKWYAVDFGINNTERLRWVLRFLKGSARSDLEAMLADGKSIKVQLRDYNWDLNSDD